MKCILRDQVKKFKIVLIIISILIPFIMMTSVSIASNSIKEIPDLSLYVNGNKISLSNVPISIEDRTLLPLRDLLVLLGVPNDDNHIIWNDSEKSVTIYKDSDKIYLKLGSTIAYVNDFQVELYVAPVYYEKNGKTYVPVRFIVQSMKKEVIWSENTQSIFICEMRDFYNVKEILDKAIDKTFKQENVVIIRSSTDFNSRDLTKTSYFEAHVDNKNLVLKKKYTQEIETVGKVFSAIGYYLNDCAYEKDLITGKWFKTPLTKTQFYNHFWLSSVKQMIFFDDVAYATMQIDDSRRDYIKVYRSTSFALSKENNKAEKCQMNVFEEIIIDRTSGMITDIKERVEEYSENVLVKKNDIVCNFKISNAKVDLSDIPRELMSEE